MYQLCFIEDTKYTNVHQPFNIHHKWGSYKNVAEKFYNQTKQNKYLLIYLTLDL